VAVISALGFAVTSSGATLRILPLGDSITQGNNNLQTYRYDLWKDLIDAGYGVQFVGSQTTNFGGNNPPYPDYEGQTFSDVNEGHFGWTLHDVVTGTYDSTEGRWGGSLSDWITGYTADIALVDLGTNDINNTPPATDAAMIADMTSVVDTLRTDNPNMAIFLAEIPVSAWETTPYAFNQGIVQLAASMTLPNSPVVAVDLTTGWVDDPNTANPDTDTWDWVHPNPLGESIIAQRFTDAILATVPAPEPGTLSLLTLGTLTILRRPRGRALAR
jgi:hypothetical protein